MSNPKVFDTQGTSWPKCPHCGYEHRDAWEWGMDDGDEERVECDNCCEAFTVTMHVSRSFDAVPAGPTVP